MKIRIKRISMCAMAVACLTAALSVGVSADEYSFSGAEAALSTNFDKASSLFLPSFVEASCMGAKSVVLCKQIRRAIRQVSFVCERHLW